MYTSNEWAIGDVMRVAVWGGVGEVFPLIQISNLSRESSEGIRGRFHCEGESNLTLSHFLSKIR